MKKQINYLVVLLSVFLFSNCSSSLFISKKKQLLNAEKYKIESLNIVKTTNKDTIILEDGKASIFGVNKKNFSVGKIKNNKQVGIWYFYRLKNDKYECHHIIKKKKNGDFKLIYSSGLKNYRFF